MGKFKRLLQQKSIYILLLLSIHWNDSNSQCTFIWGKQFGSDKDEYVLNHVTDKNGNIYVSGKTTGAMDGQNFGKNDGFITKIDSSGNSVWTRQFGTGGEEDILWSAIDDPGNVYITGSTRGILSNKNYGKEDVFVIKYDPTGQVKWTRQFGTDSIDKGNSIYVDKKGFIYITGETSGKLGQSSFGKTDGFIMKLDPDGNSLFTVQTGTSADDYFTAVSGDGRSKIYISGSTWGALDGKNKGAIDAFVGSFNEKGELIKFTQFGTDGFDMGLQLIPDDEMNIYIGGSTSGNLGGNQTGNGDCFLTKINSKGNIEWTSQFGTKDHDGIRGIDFNKNISDNILISGILNLPPGKAFIRMYKKDGSLLWENTFIGGGSGSASGKNISLDNRGNIYHLGLTLTNLFSSSIGGSDVYLVKLGLEGKFKK